MPMWKLSVHRPVPRLQRRPCLSRRFTRSVWSLPRVVALGGLGSALVRAWPPFWPPAAAEPSSLDTRGSVEEDSDLNHHDEVDSAPPVGLCASRSAWAMLPELVAATVARGHDTFASNPDVGRVGRPLVVVEPVHDQSKTAVDEALGLPTSYMGAVLPCLGICGS